MMSDFTHITIFDKPYSVEKMAEGCAISLAFAYGACNVCKYIETCSTNEKFAFPADAWCMKKKAEILKGAKNEADTFQH
ncbi:MAG: hypothetical protein J6J62_01885 [Oscillospiraceae bacterium]|nr:hypothetical protein [Oscillospiraceae bacterium]